jgi:hypothetical protein
MVPYLFHCLWVSVLILTSFADRILPDSGSATKNLSILTQKLLASSWKYDPGCLFRIIDPESGCISCPRVKKATEPGSGSAALQRKREWKAHLQPGVHLDLLAELRGLDLYERGSNSLQQKSLFTHEITIYCTEENNLNS